MAQRKYSYDSKCFDLAEAFLSDTPQIASRERAEALAQAIQTTIEDFLAEATPPSPSSIR